MWYATEVLLQSTYMLPACCALMPRTDAVFCMSCVAAGKPRDLPAMSILSSLTTSGIVLLPIHLQAVLVADRGAGGPSWVAAPQLSRPLVQVAMVDRAL
jgi:hypothetical protein